MIQDVSNRLLKDFSKCLAETIETEPPLASAPQPERAADPAPVAPSGEAPAKPVKGLLLLLSVQWERIKRLLGR